MLRRRRKSTHIHRRRLRIVSTTIRIRVKDVKNRFHPTQKRHPLFCRLLEKHTRPDDLVWDLFLGAGTTALACITTNRRCVGTERESEYFDKMREVETREA